MPWFLAEKYAKVDTNTNQTSAIFDEVPVYTIFPKFIRSIVFTTRTSGYVRGSFRNHLCY